MPALGQRFMPAEIVQAQTITEEMNDRILSMVEPPMFDLTQPEADAKDITEARDQLQRFFRSNQPSVAYLEALSAAISTRITDAVEHESALVRMNAMIILALMVDDESKPLIDKGIADKNDAVKRWAVTALGRRVLWWELRKAAGNARALQDNIDAGIAQLQTLIEQAQPPHPIIVSAGLDALLQINTPRSREALITILNQRVALHVADPNLTYSPERSALERFTNVLVSEVPPDVRSIKNYNRAMSRYASLIVADAKANRIDQEGERGAHTMLYLCLQGMANVSAAAKAPTPEDHSQARGWVVNARWDELDGLINKDWRAILIAAPIGLTADELEVKPAAE